MKKGEMHPLRIARCQHNMTIVDLAEKAKVGASTIWRAEHDYSINAESRRRLCTYFATAPDKLGLLNRAKQEPTFVQEPSTSDAPEKVHPPVHVTQKLSVAQLLLSSEGLDDRQLSAQYKQPDADTMLEMNGIAALLDANWELDTLLDALHIVFQGIQLLPSRLQRILLLGMLSRTDTSLLSANIHISEEECTQMTEALHVSIAKSRKFGCTASPIQILLSSQGLLYILRQTQNFLSPENYRSFHEAITNLIGSALFFQEYCHSTRQTPNKFYQVSSEKPNRWEQIQNKPGLKSFSPVFGQQPSFVDY